MQRTAEHAMSICGVRCWTVVVAVTSLVLPSAGCELRSEASDPEQTSVRPSEFHTRSSGSPSGSLPSWVESLNAGDVTGLLTLGRLDDPPQEVFGSIAAIATDSLGSFYVLDEQDHSVRVFSADGRYLTQFGSSGDGPGELSAPSALTLLADQSVVVAGRRGRVSRFSVGPDGISRFEGSFTIPMAALSICPLGSNVVIHGVSIGGETPIHVFGRDGQPVRSFGQLFTSDHPIIQETMSFGQVACDTARRRVFYAPRYAGTLTAFGDAGDPLWTHAFQGFRQLPYETRGEIGLFRWTTPEGTHRIVSIHAVGDFVIVQVALRDDSSSSQWDLRDVETVVFQGETGEIRGRLQGVPIIDHISLPLVFSVEREPFPRIKVLRIGGGRTSD
jgi:hypothetical protein